MYRQIKHITYIIFLNKLNVIIIASWQEDNFALAFL